MNYMIKNRYLTATISSIGAELISLKSEKIEYIWMRDPYYWKYCAPVLFPIVGNLRDKKTIINDQVYNMPLHGFLRDQMFELFHKTENEISFINTFNDDTLKLYPFKYKAIITYTLNQMNLRTSYKIINESNTFMPFNIGGHPAFNCPLYSNESFNDYSIHFSENETFLSPKVEANGTLNFNEGRRFNDLKKLDLDRNLFDIDTIVIPRIKSKTVKLLNRSDKGVIFYFPDFITFAIWTPYDKEAPFICLEPWVGYGDRYDTNHQFITKDNIINLETLDEYNIYYDITIKE